MTADEARNISEIGWIFKKIEEEAYKGNNSYLSKKHISINAQEKLEEMGYRINRGYDYEIFW